MNFFFDRSASQPLLSIGDKDLKVQAGYDVSMNEVNFRYAYTQGLWSFLAEFFW